MPEGSRCVINGGITNTARGQEGAALRACVHGGTASDGSLYMEESSMEV